MLMFRSRWLLVAGLATGCVRAESEPSVIDGPTLLLPAPGVLLARELQLTADREVTLSVTLADDQDTRTIAFDGWATVHAVPLLGLRPARTTDITVTLVARDGGTTTETLEVQTEEVSSSLPTPTVLAHDPDRMQPGYTLTEMGAGDAHTAHILIFDGQLQLRWAWTGKDVSDLRMLDNGHLFFLEGGRAVEADLLGRVVRTWAGTEVADPEAIPVDVAFFTHEVFKVADGFWSLANDRITAPLYPQSYADPLDLVADVAIKDCAVVRVLDDGTLAERWPLSERIDTQRIGFGSLQPDPVTPAEVAADWAHCNAIVEAPDGALVSLRHQDALVRLSTAGEVDWILGNHEGWGEPYRDLLLDPQGEPFSWPFHQHAPALGPSGEIVVFDNGNHRDTPYATTEPAPGEFTRVVAFAVDPDAKTVTQLWEYRDTVTGELFSPTTGDADWLDNGNVLANYGMVWSEGGVDNLELGWEVNAVRLIEFDPARPDPPALDVRFAADPGQHGGWKNFRAERIESMYGTR